MRRRRLPPRARRPGVIVDAGGVDRSGHRRHDRLRTDRARGDAPRQPAAQSRSTSTGPHVGSPARPAAMRTPGAISSHCSEVSKPPSRCARAVGPSVVMIAGAPGHGSCMSMPMARPAAACCRHHLLGDLGLHRSDGEAPPVGEHDDAVATVGTPGEVVARVRHPAVVEPELTLLVGVTAHVGGAPHRDPPVVARVGMRERQRHLLVGRLDVAERDERAAMIVADHDRQDRRAHVLGPAASVGEVDVDVTVDRRHRCGGPDLVHVDLHSALGRSPRRYLACQRRFPASTGPARSTSPPRMSGMPRSHRSRALYEVLAPCQSRPDSLASLTAVCSPR